MAKKEESSEAKAFKYLADSDYNKKKQELGRSVEKNPAFQKERKSIDKRCPRPKSEAGYMRWIAAQTKAARGRPVVYDKERRDLCDKWGIDYHAFIRGKVIGANTVRVRTHYIDGQAVPILEPVPGKISTEIDKREHLPFMQWLEGQYHGKPRRGRVAKNADRDKAIRAEVKRRRSQGEKPDDIFDDLAKRYGRSSKRIRDIARNKKND